MDKKQKNLLRLAFIALIEAIFYEFGDSAQADKPDMKAKARATAPAPAPVAAAPEDEVFGGEEAPTPAPAPVAPKKQDPRKPAPPAAAAPTGISRDEVKLKFQAVAKTWAMPETKEFLKKFNAGRFTDIKDSDLAAFNEALEKAELL